MTDPPPHADSMRAADARAADARADPREREGAVEVRRLSTARRPGARSRGHQTQASELTLARESLLPIARSRRKTGAAAGMLLNRGSRAKVSDAI